MPDALSTADARELSNGMIVWGSPSHHPDANILVAKYLGAAGDGPVGFRDLSVMRSTKFLYTPDGWSVQETLEIEQEGTVRIADADASVPDAEHRVYVQRVTPNTIPDMLQGAEYFGRARHWEGCGAHLPGQFYKSTEVLPLHDAKGSILGHLIRKTSIRFTSGVLQDCSVTLSYTSGSEPLHLSVMEVPEAVAPSATFKPAELG